ncbi:MAG: DUF3309 domain-containing protein [Alphaproteobacteria bacterium]|nr:DUF3309 domain-containing protein [Alphaproteobacteria bacterium]
MLLGLSLVLATAAVALFPRWTYSQRWGYAPSTIVAILLVTVAAAAASGRPASSTDLRVTRALPAPAAPLHNPTIDNARDRLLWSSAPSIAAIPTDTSVD